VVRDRRNRRHGRRARRGGQPEPRVPVRLAADGGPGGRAHRYGRCRRGLQAHARPGCQHAGSEHGRAAGTSGGLPGFAASWVATALSHREPAGRLTLVLPAARRPFKRAIAGAIIANLADTDTLGARDTGADDTSTLTDLADTDTDLADTDLTLTDTDLADTDLTLAVTDNPLAITNVVVANTIANLAITNVADADLPVTLFAVRNVALVAGARRIVARHPGVALCAVVSDFEEQVGVPEGDARRLVAFLGGTIGNLLPAQRIRNASRQGTSEATFLTSLRARLRPGDALLLGTDLVKDPAAQATVYGGSACLLRHPANR
jgi:hypothetical protein